MERSKRRDEGVERGFGAPFAVTNPMSSILYQNFREGGGAPRGPERSTLPVRERPESALGGVDVVTVGSEARDAVREIVALVHRRTGTDFSRYRAATVERRIRNRMISLGLDNTEQYLACLLAEPAETSRLVDRLTIKVSRFYRNRPVFDCLRREVFPALAERAGGRPLRVWSAGCAFGEEAYSLAMLLQESGGAGLVDASDLDAGALMQAREGIYPEEACRELPDDLCRRYLVPAVWRRGPARRVRAVLRDRVRFIQQDLTLLDLPTGRDRYDLVCCRNVLIYLQRAAQQALFSRVFSSVAPGGFLCLGEAEWPPPSHADHLRCLGRKTRVFRKVETESLGGRW